MRVHRDRGPSALRQRSRRTRLDDKSGLEMSDVVDAADHHPAVALFDQRDGCVLDPERPQAAAGPPDHAVERDLDHAAVGDEEDVAVLMPLDDLVQRSADPCIEKRGALAAGHDVPIRLLDPRRPCLGESGRDLFGPQSFPLAEKDLSQSVRGLRLGADDAADDLRGLEGAFQVARVEPDEAAFGQPAAEELGLTAALVRKWRIELALDPVVTVPSRLAVADEDEARRCGTNG